MISAIAFDCFGVILNDYGRNWLDSSGLSPEDQLKIHALFKKRDLGELEGDAYYAKIGEVAGIDPAVLDAKEHHVGSLDPMLVNYVKNDLSNRYRIFLASNSSAGLLSELLEKDGFNNLFERVFVSSDMGVIKPEAGFYQHILDATGIPAAEILFVDDRERNVAGAVASGMQGYHYDGFAEFRSYLEKASGA